jgi:GntR family transcriptional repressor for pyruvate dehydrogenase complex
MTKNPVKVTSSKLTTDYLREKIFSQKVKVGDKLATEHEICETLKVGRGTVREAFRTLESEGLVEIIPGRGAFVIQRDDAVQKKTFENWFTDNQFKLRDYIEVRNIIEPMAARMAAERASDDQIERLKKNYDALKDNVAKAHFSALAALDEEFHSIIVEMTGNSLMIFIMNEVNIRMRNFRSNTFYSPHNANNAIMAHGKILSAISERDANIAEVYMKRHIKLIVEDIDISIHGSST